MAHSHLKHLPTAITFSLLLALLVSPTQTLAGKCNKDDKKALLAIDAYFGFPYHFASWTNNTACCDWYDVDCDPQTGRVVGLSVFADNNLNGTIPPAVGDLPFLQTLVFHKLPLLTGNIPETITKLKHLSILELTWNSLSGPVPAFLSQLTSLITLSLSFNQFSGTIPPSLSELTNLQGLFLDRNMLTGPIPDTFGSFPDNFYLVLSHNNLSGPIPASLGHPKWTRIDLSRNQLIGDASVLFSQSKPTSALI